MTQTSIRLTREMGITHADFFRTLPGVLEGEHLEVGDQTARIEDDHGVVSVKLSEERERKLGSLSLPTVTVELHFRGHSAEQVDAFMRRFEMHFRRGGG